MTRQKVFNNNFEVFLADTEESKKIHYAIRYKVYCEEMGYENVEDFETHQESDDFDLTAAHFIVKHKSTDTWVGAMRLIFKDNQLLPIEIFCNLFPSDEQILEGKSAELSRLCVVKEIRRANAYSTVADDKKLMFDRKTSRCIIWGLIFASVEFSYINKIESLLFFTTRALAKILCDGGLELTSIGEPCDHRGIRYPAKMNVNRTYLDNIQKNNDRVIFKLFSAHFPENK